ncbi:TetR/AcrR family transcriptional regulator [Bifidobacterium eulemuris]|uniref:Transcriptional regulator n=1 Tax=Bifidobacterium eulemuris TaxID=1765219 RepID=A0A261G8M8_9BIFI|nr:TetR family transcriptional regulator [Bifidobacterium eulemuris]OZG67545.1 transcriptional regulator [Bifidobacterium eulemuris]QOL31081.1 TetR/AcrR family transcriptional regulator [Bifidobacterium eulemuris]
MDLRVVKTLKNIERTFLDLAAKDGIEDMTVKSLCTHAQINKATFYAHYAGMHELLEDMEDKAIEEIRADNVIDERALRAPTDFLMRMLDACGDNEAANIFMNSGRRSTFVRKLFAGVREDLYRRFPELRDSEGFDFVLTFVFHGLMGVTTEYDENKDDKRLIASRLGEGISLMFQRAMA